MSDYVARHPELMVGINATTELSDYAARHPGLKLGINVAAEMSDYALRHPGLKLGTNEKVDLSWPPRPDFSILNQKGISRFAGDQGYAPRHSLEAYYSLGGSGGFAGDQGYAPRHR
jgi:hypothetical protein